MSGFTSFVVLVGRLSYGFYCSLVWLFCIRCVLCSKACYSVCVGSDFMLVIVV